MTITARYAGRCAKCRQPFPVGTMIAWERGSSAHTVCPPVPVKAEAPASPAVSLNLASVAQFLTAAHDRGLAFPKARFLAPGGSGELRLSVAGPTSRAAGSVQVKVNDTWIGRVDTDGTVYGPMTDRPAILDTLRAIAEAPAKAAQAYGALMGRCSFCALQLTDAGSVEVGYGPICAARYGLPHTPKGTPTATRPDAQASL